MRSLGPFPFVVLSFVTIAATGCAFRTPTPDVPSVIGGDEQDAPSKVDVARVAVSSRVLTLDTDEIANVREETAKILRDAAAKADSGGAQLIVRADVDLGAYRDYASESMRDDGMAVFGWLFMWPAGTQFEQQALTVTLTIERDGRTFRGLGAADVGGSVYAPARKRALAIAIDRALADAAES